MTGEALATLMLCIVGWGWTLRAGIKIANYDRSSFAKRVAIGNAIVSLIPFVAVIFINLH